MAKDTVRGSVIEVLPAGLYKVDIEGKEYLCYIGGKMKMNHIRVLLGDLVDVILDPYKGKATNRIVQRVKQEPL